MKTFTWALNLDSGLSDQVGVHVETWGPQSGRAVQFAPGQPASLSPEILLVFWFLHQKESLEHHRQSQAAGPDPSSGLAWVPIQEPGTTAWISIMGLGQMARKESENQCSSIVFWKRKVLSINAHIHPTNKRTVGKMIQLPSQPCLPYHFTGC